jgi:hypothetical protein
MKMDMEKSIESLLAKLDANHEEIMAKRDAETEAMRDKGMEVNMNACRKEMTAWGDETETEPDPGMMLTIEEYQEIPKRDTAGMPVGGPRKRRRVRNLVEECRQKMRERTQGNYGSRRNSAVACRKVFRRAKVAWRKRNLIRKIRILGKCGRLKEFAAAGIRTVLCSKVARRKGRNYKGRSVEQGRRKNKTRKKITRGTRKGRMLRRRQLMGQEGTNGTRNRDVKEELRLGDERTTRGIYRKCTGLEIAKRIFRCTVGLQRMKDWTLWRGRPSPKR